MLKCQQQRHGTVGHNLRIQSTAAWQRPASSPLAGQRVLEARLGKAANALLRVVHAQGHALACTQRGRLLSDLVSIGFLLACSLPCCTCQGHALTYRGEG